MNNGDINENWSDDRALRHNRGLLMLCVRNARVDADADAGADAEGLSMKTKTTTSCGCDDAVIDAMAEDKTLLFGISIIGLHIHAMRCDALTCSMLTAKKRQRNDKEKTNFQGSDP